MIASAVAQAIGLSVTIANGTINGAKCASADANMYLGVPYAKAPTGDLRFAPPQPLDKKFGNGKGILNATMPAPACPQFGAFFIEDGTQSEDCLMVDVYVPSHATAKSELPVKVWVYGGSNEAGSISDPTYNGCFSVTDSIVVSINYRVGPLGFLNLPKAGVEGNFGSGDQLAALRWVQENIGAFGGDPDKVLLFGQSAGALDCFVLSTLPEAPSLMQAAAFESGGGRDLPTTLETQTHNLKFVDLLGCSDTNIGCLRSKSLAELNKTTNDLESMGPHVPKSFTLFQNNGFGSDWGPSIDGKLIVHQPSKVGSKIPIIIGSNGLDGSLFVLLEYPTTVLNITEKMYHEFLESNFGNFSKEVLAVYPFSGFDSGFTAMSTIITDAGERCPAFRGARIAANNGMDVWTYSFDLTPTCAWFNTIPNDPAVLDLLNATHTAEIPFVFGLVDKLPPPGGNCNFTKAEKAVSRFMDGSWTRMAAKGRPDTEQRWPKWTECDGKGITINGDGVDAGVVDYSVCALWDKINAKILKLDNSGALISGN